MYFQNMLPFCVLFSCEVHVLGFLITASISLAATGKKRDHQSEVVNCNDFSDLNIVLLIKHLVFTKIIQLSSSVRNLRLSSCYFTNFSFLHVNNACALLSHLIHLLYYQWHLLFLLTCFMKLVLCHCNVGNWHRRLV